MLNSSKQHQQHPEDEAHLSSSEEETEEELHQQKIIEAGGDFEPDMPSFTGSSALTHSNYNTGVKGVIADAQSYERSRRKEMREQRERQEKAYLCPATSSNEPSLLEQAPLYSDDDELMVQWRKTRLAELKAATVASRQHTPSKRQFGKVESVDAMGYLDAIEKVPKDTVVVVAVYSDRSKESSFVLDSLDILARKYTTTRFISLHHAEAEMDEDVVPAILAYKGAELFQSVMSVVDEIPSGRSLTTESLEMVLLRQLIVSKD